MIELTKHQINICYMTIGVAVVCILSNCFDSATRGENICNTYAIKLMKKAIRLNKMSHNDKLIGNAYKHANYAIAYLDAAREFASDKLLEYSTKTDIQTFNKHLYHKQHEIGKHIR